MTLPVSLVLIAVGAILVWGVTTDAEGINVDAIGVILIVVGLIGFLISLLFWDRWGWGAWTNRRTTVVDGGPAVRRRYVEAAPRTRVVEEEVEDVAPRPPGPPPP